MVAGSGSGTGTGTGTVRVLVPATSANLGPGFDVAGLALDLSDHYQAWFSGQPGVRVETHGEGAGFVPSDQSHLVAVALLRGMADLDLPVVGLEISCRNAIPHSRGLGSSAAAIVGGLLLARGLAATMDPELASRLDEERLLHLATSIEGHPDNVAAALLGGFTLAWLETGGPRAVSLAPDPRISAAVFIPSGKAGTHEARGALPSSVPLADAVSNVGRAAVLVRAMTAAPHLLTTATEDRLHQQYRRGVYPASLELVEQLRSEGHAAFISGAGPTVAVLGDGPALAGLPEGFEGFDKRALAIASGAMLQR